MKKKIVLVVSLFLLGIVGCSSSELMVSSPVKDIAIDGDHKDWSGKLKYYEDEKVAIGFQNDSENLYFCLVTSDRATAMKIMLLGLTVWFEPENGEQEMGLQFPKRMEGASARSLLGTGRQKEENTDFEVTVNTMMQYQGEYLLVDDDEEILYAAPLGSNDGFEIKVDAINQQFIYEAKVPIANNSLAQLPINIFPNEKVTIRFEMGEIDFEEMRKNGGMGGMSGGGMAGGGMAGGGMAGGGKRGGGRGGANRAGMETLNFDVEVKLSK